MKSLFVKPDGTVAVVTDWEEGGYNVVVYNKTGSMRSVPEGSGTGGWGRMSMTGVALDDQYTYQLLSQNGCDGANTSLNNNGLPQYPACGDQYTWKTVRRYKLDSGLPAPFAKGYGYRGDMLIVHSGPGNLSGIAISGNELIVSDEWGDSVKVYDKVSMSSVPLRKFKLSGGVGPLSPDKDGSVWMLQKARNRIVRFDLQTGSLLLPELVFPDSVVVSAFMVDTLNEKMLLADNGVSQKILVYTGIHTDPQLFSTFGKQYGIFSGIPGQVAPLKFFDLTGVGCDASGNIYVTNSMTGGGAILQSYNPDGTLRWERKGLMFTGTAATDDQNPADVYTCDKKVTMDYTRSEPGTEWSFSAITLNRFKYPDDPRLHGGFYTSCWIRHIQGQKYLFATDMYGSQLAGFRFLPESDGEIAIPCLFMNIGGWDVNSSYPVRLGNEKDFIWMDLNGDGSIQSDEFTYRSGFENRYSMSVWVDSMGNIWKGAREQGVRLIPLQSVNSNGVPVYDFEKSVHINISNGKTGINGIKRIVYDRSRDELYISGFSEMKPDKKANGENTDTWWCMGSTICRYDQVMDTLNKNPHTDFRNVNPSWRIYIPFAADGETDNEKNGKSFTAGGEYLFIARARNGVIAVHKRENGEYLGIITPGTEVGGESGWTDINYSLNVQVMPSEYLLFNEENGFAKVIMYRISSFETNDILYPDLVPSNLILTDAEGNKVQSIRKDDQIRFRVTIHNQGPGLSKDGSYYSNGKSIRVNFQVRNIETNNKQSFVADTCTLPLGPGDSLIINSYSLTAAYQWMAGKGYYEVTATVNPSASIFECNRSNNTVLNRISTFDTVHIYRDISDVTVNSGKPAFFSVIALGNDPIVYYWYLDQVLQEGINSNTFVIEKPGLIQNGSMVQVVAVNQFGSDTSRLAMLIVKDPYGYDKPGFLLQEDWYGFSGTEVNDLRNHSGFPDKPDSIHYINKFETASNVRDNYGSRVSGWLLPPQTGYYLFYFASDDFGELWLSTDSLKENIGSIPIANVPGWTDPRQYNKYPEQTSSPVFLESGKVYYTEALFKEEGGGDNLSVAWKLPDGTIENPVSSKNLAFYTGIKATGVDVSRSVFPGLRIFPVPASDLIYIDGHYETEKLHAEIWDITGQIQWEGYLNNINGKPESLSVCNLPQGIYLLCLKGNNTVDCIKFIIIR